MLEAGRPARPSATRRDARPRRIETLKTIGSSLREQALRLPVFARIPMTGAAAYFFLLAFSRLSTIVQRCEPSVAWMLIMSGGVLGGRCLR